MREVRVPGAQFDIVFYADDTTVVSRTKEACELLLEKIEAIFEEHGLKLNKDKCVNLNMNTEEQQTLRNGEKLVKAEEAVYLGNTLSSKANVAAEIDRQIQQVNITLWKLNAYSKASEASKKWQLLIFDAVIKGKLLYGMETVQMTEAMMKRVDAFQMKGPRKILGKKHTYWDR